MAREVQLVGGKDCSSQVGKKWAALGKTVSLMLQMTESSFNSDMVVKMDSGFCVYEAISELDRVGIFVEALKKICF